MYSKSGNAIYFPETEQSPEQNQILEEKHPKCQTKEIQKRNFPSSVEQDYDEGQNCKGCFSGVFRRMLHAN